jgi:hypothetical protein
MSTFAAMRDFNWGTWERRSDSLQPGGLAGTGKWSGGWAWHGARRTTHTSSNRILLDGWLLGRWAPGSLASRLTINLGATRRACFLSGWRRRTPPSGLPQTNVDLSVASRGSICLFTAGGFLFESTGRELDQDGTDVTRPVQNLPWLVASMISVQASLAQLLAPFLL